MWKMFGTHCLYSWLSVWSQLVQWSALIGKRMWMKTCIQNITGSLQTTSRGLTCMLQNPSASGASRRSSVTDVATENPTCQRSNCDSASSTGKTHYNSIGYWGFSPANNCSELTGYCLISQAWEHSQRCQSQLPHRHQSAILEWWRSDCQHDWGAWPLSSRICRRPKWISPGLFQWWTWPLLFPGGTLVNTLSAVISVIIRCNLSWWKWLCSWSAKWHV